MGNDGGSIPTRRELVKEAARNPTAAELKSTQAEQQSYLWSTDPLTRKPLSPPIVSDSNGHLYNKVSIIERLLAASSEDPPADTPAEPLLPDTIASLKDIVELHFQTAADDDATFRCPVTNAALGPGAKAAYLVPCGHVFSGAAVKEVLLLDTGDAEDARRCVVCEEFFAPNDVVPVLPTAAEDVARLQLRIRTLRDKGLSHALKKAAGRKAKKGGRKRARDDAGEEAPALVPAAVGRAEERARAKPDVETINNSGTRALTDKVLLEQEARKKARMGNGNLQSLFSSRDQGRRNGRNTDFMTRGFEIPADAKR